MFSTRTLTGRAIVLAAMALFAAAAAFGQSAGDPTAVPAAPAPQAPAEQAPYHSSAASTALLVTGLAATAGGAALIIYSGQFRDAGGSAYYLPLISGVALSAAGLICTVVGVANGMGGESYQPIVPNVDPAAPVKTGLYFFVGPGSAGLALR